MSPARVIGRRILRVADIESTQFGIEALPTESE